MSAASWRRSQAVLVQGNRRERPFTDAELDRLVRTLRERNESSEKVTLEAIKKRFDIDGKRLRAIAKAHAIDLCNKPKVKARGSR